MQGFRTIIATWISAVVAPFLINRFGITLSADEQLQLVAMIMAGVATAFRMVTRTPVGQKEVAADAQRLALTPAMLNTIVGAVIQEIVRRKVAAKLKEKTQ
jgi:uncharacterized membrane protein YeaQ/YmgE (transglycosylase-associated protein family)